MRESDGSNIVWVGFGILFLIIVGIAVTGVFRRHSCVEACKQDGRNTFECVYVICEHLR